MRGVAPAQASRVATNLNHAGIKGFADEREDCISRRASALAG